MFRNGFLGSKLVEMKKKCVQIVHELWFLWAFVFSRQNYTGCWEPGAKLCPAELCHGILVYSLCKYSAGRYQHASFCPFINFMCIFSLSILPVQQNTHKTRNRILSYYFRFWAFQNVSLCDWSKILRKCQFWSPLGTHCRKTIRVTGTMLVSLESCTFLPFKSKKYKILRWRITRPFLHCRVGEGTPPAYFQIPGFLRALKPDGLHACY